MFGEAWPPMSVPLAPDDDDETFNISVRFPVFLLYILRQGAYLPCVKASLIILSLDNEPPIDM